MKFRSRVLRQGKQARPGPEVGPGAPVDEVPGAANTIQSGRAMLVSLLARSSAGGTVSPVPGGPRRRAAYLGDSWKGTEVGMEAGGQVGRHTGGKRQLGGRHRGRNRSERVGLLDPNPSCCPGARGPLRFIWSHSGPQIRSADSPSHHAPPPARTPTFPVSSLTHVLFSMVSDQLPKFKIPSDHCHLA